MLEVEEEIEAKRWNMKNTFVIKTSIYKAEQLVFSVCVWKAISD